MLEWKRNNVIWTLRNSEETGFVSDAKSVFSSDVQESGAMWFTSEVHSVNIRG